MARNGSGTYNRAVSPYTAGTTITAATVNQEMDDIATALTGSMARDGQSPATANIPMGGFRITGLANAVASTDAAALGQITAAQAGAVAKAGDTMTGALNFAPWVDLASAGTTDIGAQTSNNVRITGTTTITSFGTAASGVTRELRFAGALTLTHNATSLILPGGANIVTMAGDTATARSLGSGNWVVTDYTQAIGPSWQLCEAPRVVSGVASLDLALPTGFRRYRLTVQDGVVNTSGQSLLLRFSSDGGATFLSASNYVQIGNVSGSGPGNSPFYSTTSSSIALTPALPSGTSNAWDGTFDMNPGSASLSARVRGSGIGVNSIPEWAHGYWGGAWGGTSARMNAIRILVGSGTLSGTFILEGMR